MATFVKKIVVESLRQLKLPPSTRRAGKRTHLYIRDLTNLIATPTLAKTGSEEIQSKDTRLEKFRRV